MAERQQEKRPTGISLMIIYSIIAAVMGVSTAVAGFGGGGFGNFVWLMLLPPFSVVLLALSLALSNNFGYLLTGGILASTAAILLAVTKMVMAYGMIKREWWSWRLAIIFSSSVIVAGIVTGLGFATDDVGRIWVLITFGIYFPILIYLAKSNVVRVYFNRRKSN
jgi:hypothetical protein